MNNFLSLKPLSQRLGNKKYKKAMTYQKNLKQIINLNNKV